MPIRGNRSRSRSGAASPSVRSASRSERGPPAVSRRWSCGGVWRVRELVLGLALRVRGGVLPELGAYTGRVHAGAGAGGDVTFAIDADAEAEVERFLAERAPRMALYSE